MLERVDVEHADFERCIARLQALRSVQAKMLRETLAPLSSDLLRREVTAMQGAAGLRIVNTGAARAFATLGQRMHEAVGRAAAHAQEMRQMVEASFAQLNAEYGFAFQLGPLPDLTRFDDELALIERRYGKHLTVTRAWRLAAPGAAEQFRRMLLSKLRVVFETASSELEMWSKSAESQIESQLRERRHGFKRRREALERIQSAAGELEQRIGELEAQEQHLRELQHRLDALVGAIDAATHDMPELTARRDAA
jgi:hypothetical protein